MPLVSSRKDPDQRVVTATPQAAPAPAPTPLDVNPNPVRLTSVDTRWTPRNALITHIEGSSWIVDYYSQILTADSELSGQQVTANAVFQSYKRVIGMEVKVTSALTTTQDDETKAMKVEGAAMLYPFIIPNEGDMFSADIGQGKLGLFRVTSTVKKSIFQEACYEISYGLVNDNPTFIADLRNKSVETVYFHKDYLTYGQNPLLIKSDAEALVDLEHQYTLVLRNYINRFYSKEFCTFLTPKQSGPTYDHYLNAFIASNFMSSGIVPELYGMKLLNVDNCEELKADNLWTALSLRDVGLINTVFKRAGLATFHSFSMDPMLESIRWSGFHHLVYPLDPVETVDSSLAFAPAKPAIVAALRSSYGDSPAPTNIPTPVAMNLRGVFAPDAQVTALVTVDDYYVLSQKFYTGSAQMSVLESIAWQYLRREKLDFAQLLEMSKLYHSWGMLEQFYYVPMLLLFIRSAMKGI